MTLAPRFRGRAARLPLFWVLALSLTLPACGYRLGGRPCESAGEVLGVAVPLFQNRSYTPRAEDFFTEAFRDRLQFLPCYRLRGEERAGAVLKGTVQSLESYPVAVDSQFLALQYSLRVVLTLSLESRPDGRVLWQAERVEDEIRYYASSDPLLFQDNRQEALKRLAWRLADRMLDQLSLGF